MSNFASDKYAKRRDRMYYKELLTGYVSGSRNTDIKLLVRR